MKKIYIIFSLLLFLITFNAAAHEFVEVKVGYKNDDYNYTNDYNYSLGLEQGSISSLNYYEYYTGISGAFRINDNTYLKLVVGKSSDLMMFDEKMMVIGKAMVFFKRDIKLRAYGFGLVGNFNDDIVVGGGLGYEKNFGFAEFAYTTGQYTYVSCGLNFYF